MDFKPSGSNGENPPIAVGENERCCDCFGESAEQGSSAAFKTDALVSVREFTSDRRDALN